MPRAPTATSRRSHRSPAPRPAWTAPRGSPWTRPEICWRPTAGAESITAYSPTQPGDQTPAITITGPATGLADPEGVDVDAQGNIYVASQFAGIAQFAPNANGNVAPTTNIHGPATGLLGPYALAVAPPLAIATTHLRAARARHHYRTRLHANLGTMPYRWTRHGHLPPGVRLAHDGLITGRPTRPGRYAFTVRVTDATHPRMTASQRLTLTVRRT